MTAKRQATMIRCPVCCARLEQPHPEAKSWTEALALFSKDHQRCRGQQLGGCGCEWERLCNGLTLLGRTADPCEECAAEFPDGSVARCPGCAECKT